MYEYFIIVGNILLFWQHSLTLVLIIPMPQISYKEFRTSDIGQHYDTLAYQNYTKDHPTRQ